MANAGTWAEGLDVDRVSIAAGPVVLIKVGIFQERAGHGQDQAQGSTPSAPEG